MTKKRNSEIRKELCEQEFGTNSATAASEILRTHVSHGSRKIPVCCTPWENTRHAADHLSDGWTASKKIVPNWAHHW